MALQRWVSGLAPALVGVWVSSLSTPAQACSLDPCPSTVGLPSQAYLPGNLVYFPIVGDDPPAIELRTAAGEVIPASIRSIGSDRVFAPEQPIAEDTQLVLEYSIACLAQPEPFSQTFEFTTTTPGEIELVPGKLEVEEVGLIDPGGEAEKSFVRVRHFSGDANGIATPLMHHTYTVDGVQTWGLRTFGYVELLEVAIACRPQFSELVTDSCGSFNSAPPGLHTVEVSTHIVGAETQPEPVRLEVDVQCPDAAAVGGDDEPEPSSNDATAQPADPTSDTDDSAASFVGDTEVGSDILPEPATAPVATSRGGGGCALDGSGAGAGGLWALAVAVVLGRARRSRSAR